MIRISPTQVSLWRSCKRKFAFTYLADLPRTPQTKAQQIGSALHSRISKYVSVGVLDYENAQAEVEQEAVRLLPHLIGVVPTNTFSEQKITVPVADSWCFSGYFDWVYESPAGLIVGDLKTTSNLKYAKTKTELEKDPQALIYAVGAEEEYHKPVVGGQWVYIQTKGAPKVHVVDFVPDMSAWSKLEEDGALIADAWAHKSNPNDHEPNYKTCDDYGGCPFRNQCYKEPHEQLMQLGRRMGLAMEQTVMGTQQDMDFDKLIAKATGTDEEPQAVNPPMPATSPAPESPTIEAEPTAGSASMVATAAPAAAPAEAPKKRSRPRKTETVPVPTAQPETEAPAADKFFVDVLYLSCRPDNGAGVDDAYYMIATVIAEINSKAGVEDYRLIQYGQGAGMLVAGVVDKVKSIRPAELFLDERTPEGRLLSGPLSALAVRVVRGL